MYNLVLVLYIMIKYILEIYKWNVSENVGIYLKEIVLIYIYLFDLNYSVNRCSIKILLSLDVVIVKFICNVLYCIFFLSLI